MKTVNLILPFVVSIVFSFSTTAQNSTQNNDNNSVFSEDSHLLVSEDESYKTITFLYDYIDTDQELIVLENLLLNSGGIIDCKLDKENHMCNVKAKLSVKRANIVQILSVGNYKISEYNEEVHFIVNTNAPVVKNIQNDEYVRQHLELYKREDIANSASKAAYEAEPGVVITSERILNGDEKLTDEQRLEKYEKLKEMAIKNGYPTDKYDVRINEIKTKINNK